MLQSPIKDFSQEKILIVSDEKTKEKNRAGISTKCFSHKEKHIQKQDELLPNIKPRTSHISTTINSNSNSIDFDKSFLYKKNQLSMEDFDKKLYGNFKKEETTTDFERQILESEQGRLIKVANCILKMRMEEQFDLFNSFKILNEKLKFLRYEKSKVLEDLAKNAKLEDFWMSAKTIISYLSTGIGIFIGLGMTGIGAYNANSAIIKSGIVTVLGGIGSATSQWMNHKKYNETLTTAIAVCSSLIIGYNAIPKTLFPSKWSTIQALFQLKEGIVGYQISNIKKTEYTIKEQEIKLQHHQEKNKSKLAKYLGGMKLNEYLNEVKALSTQIGKEDELKERIAQILSSAV